MFQHMELNYTKPSPLSLEEIRDWRCRCSYLANIMSNPTGDLSQGAKTWLKKLVDFGYPSFSTPATQKGIDSEDIAIKAYASPRACKNEFHLANQFITGTPDILFLTKIQDIKCPFKFETFEAVNASKAMQYYWQMQGYLWLADLPLAELLYCWIDENGFSVSKKKGLKKIKIKRNRKAKKAIKNKILLARQFLMEYKAKK